jgi:hypothetical protein
MQRGNNREPALEAEAFVRRVDPVNRELAALVGGVPVTIYVPPDCEVVLRGERVKLRMVQPGDRVRVTCTEFGDTLVARELAVQPAYPPSSISR